MIIIPEITPVRNKTEPINEDLINPDVMSPTFEYGPRIVYLDEIYEYPKQVSNDPIVERERQDTIWNQHNKVGGGFFLDRAADEVYDPTKLSELKSRVLGELGTRYSAEYYGRVYSEVLSFAMKVVVISSGVSSFGENFHDIGYLA